MTATACVARHDARLLGLLDDVLTGRRPDVFEHDVRRWLDESADALTALGLASSKRDPVPVRLLRAA